MSVPVCPRFHKAIELIGGRWTGPILQVLLAGPVRFAEVRDSIPNISDRMLSERLHELEAEGILTRSVIPSSPVRVEYVLTQKGRELQASLNAVGRWATKWIPELGPESAPPAPPARESAARKTRVRPRRPRRAAGGGRPAL